MHKSWLRRLSVPLDQTSLKTRVRNALARQNIRYVIDLVLTSWDDIYRLKYFGRGMERDLRRLLDELGLALGMYWKDVEIAEVRDEIARQQEAARSSATTRPR